MSDAPRRRAIPSTAALRFCGWQLDCRTRRFTNPAGTPVALLLAFLNAPQRPLSREYLLQATRVHEMFSIAASMCRFFACGYPTPRSVWMTHGALGSFQSSGFERRRSKQEFFENDLKSNIQASRAVRQKIKWGVTGAKKTKQELFELNN